MRLSAPIYRLKRQAKQMSRDGSAPLNEALNSIAKREGFQSWGLLAARHANTGPATKIFANLTPGDLVLLGARPGQGKTLMGLEFIVESLKVGNQAAFYSLEYTEAEIAKQLHALDADITISNDAFTFDTSDDICADYIIEKLKAVRRGTVVVIDYLQLLDQNRLKPIVAAQLSALKSFADAAGIIVIILSQIDRTYDPTTKPLPDCADIRLPNPLDLKLFTRTIFINDGVISSQAVT